MRKKEFLREKSSFFQSDLRLNWKHDAFPRNIHIRPSTSWLHSLMKVERLENDITRTKFRFSIKRELLSEKIFIQVHLLVKTTHGNVNYFSFETFLHFPLLSGRWLGWHGLFKILKTVLTKSACCVEFNVELNSASLACVVVDTSLSLKIIIFVIKFLIILN